jgi:hypothetical protein
MVEGKRFKTLSCKKMKDLQNNNALKRLPCRTALQGEWTPSE